MPEKSFSGVCYVHWHIIDAERDSHEMESDWVMKVPKINDEHNARAHSEAGKIILTYKWAKHKGEKWKGNNSRAQEKEYFG